MPSSGMLHHGALVIADISEERGASEISALTIATRRNIPEDGILHSHHRENLKSYMDFLIDGSCSSCNNSHFIFRESGFRVIEFEVTF
jgi:hypothetical protein